MALVLDTGPLVAATISGDTHHEACAKLLRECPEELVVPVPVLPEVDYFLLQAEQPKAFQSLIADIRTRALRAENLLQVDYERISQLLTAYAKAKIGFVDAAVMAVVERLGETKLATLDRQHFSLMKPAHCDYLSLLPDS